MTVDPETGWTIACTVNDVGPDATLRWDYRGHSYAIFRSDDGRFFATDNICTHEHAILSDGYVEGSTVECPRHSGRFNFITGQAMGAPVCVDLKTYPVTTEAGNILVKTGQ